jgi:DNA repair exonuclease SbcCD nuclease subunit
MKETKIKTNIVLCGDIHGAFNKLRYDVNRLHEDAYIIQVGDFGMGFQKPNYYKDHAFPDLNEVLEKKNCHLYVIRGNHDDPSYFSQTNNPFDFSNITLLSDYSELNLLGKSILLVGGAVSVDRRFRHEGKSWWSDEDFNLKLEDQFPYKDRQYDLVVTHTRPGVCGAFKGFDNIKYWCDQDPDLKNDLIDESQQLDYLYEHTKPKNWIYGHFHKTMNTDYENTVFRCLDIDEYYQYFVLTSPDSSL